MTEIQQPKAPFFHRVAVKFFALILTVLLFWLLGFLVQDIDKMKGPQLKTFENIHLDKILLSQNLALSQEIKALKADIANKQDEQRILRTSTSNLQNTISQILAIQKSDKTHQAARTQAESKAFSDSLNLFLTNQKTFQKINLEMSSLSGKKQKLLSQQKQFEERLSKQRDLARDDFRSAQKTHNMTIALYKLVLLVPLLVLALFLTFKNRTSTKLPLWLAFSIAIVLKVALVIHDHFPSKLFKYVLIFILIVATIKLLIYFIQAVASPHLDILLKQYREAYERFQCPICEFPIRRGPMKYLYWTKKTIKNLKLPAGDYDDTEYHCPSCGTGLYQACGSCDTIRHSLLPYCVGCQSKLEKGI